jgi:hypothetical protein
MSSKHVLPWAVRLPCSGGPVLFHVWFYLTLTLVSGCTDRDQARMGVGSAALAACDDGNPCTADLAFCPEGPNVPPELCPNLQCFHHPYPALPGEPHPFDDVGAPAPMAPSVMTGTSAMASTPALEVDASLPPRRRPPESTAGTA